MPNKFPFLTNVFHEPLLKFPCGLFKDCLRFTQYPLKRYTKSTPNPLGNIREVIFSNEMLRKLFQKQQKSLDRHVKIDNEYNLKQSIGKYFEGLCESLHLLGRVFPRRICLFLNDLDIQGLSGYLSSFNICFIAKHKYHVISSLWNLQIFRTN